MCHGFECHQQNLKLSIYHRSNYHMRVIYPTNVIYSAHLRTEAITYPTGFNVDKATFTSHEIGKPFYRTSLYVSLSSIINHINCSKPTYETADWSGLSINVIKNVYLEEEMKENKKGNQLYL